MKAAIAVIPSGSDFEHKISSGLWVPSFKALHVTQETMEIFYHFLFLIKSGL